MFALFAIPNYKMKKADAILTADWHIRESTPVCRIDDFWQAQWKKVKFISELQKKHNCKVLHSGDLFDDWKPSPFLLSHCIENLPAQFHTIYGNHDLPQHNLELAEKSGVHCLSSSKTISLIKNGMDWGQSDNGIPCFEDMSVKVMHIMTFQGKRPYPGCTDLRSIALLKKYPDYDLLLSGHNHKPFTEKHEGRLLVNPGSLTRQSAGDTFKPRVYLWYKEENEIELVYLPFEEGVITREHIDKVEQRDGRIDSFISTLKETKSLEMNFEATLKQMLEENKLEKDVESIILKSLEND